MIKVVLALVAAALLQILLATAAYADQALGYSGPGCISCKAPAPPPQAVPTAPPYVIPSGPVIAVRISPTKVRRGKSIVLQVTAPIGDSVDVQIRFDGRKPVNFGDVVDSTGTYGRSWKVPDWVPLGKAKMIINVGDRAAPDPFVVGFEVVK